MKIISSDYPPLRMSKKKGVNKEDKEKNYFFFLLDLAR
jgi:hypothetical protein